MRLRPQFDDQNVALRVDSPGLRVSGDPDRLTQVIVNLLGNALSYTPSGGTVEVTGRRRNGHIELAVGDTGRGLSTADLQRVFERFYRADPSSIGGSGIGLTIARGIARAHGGDVVAHSDGPGAGATFTLVLPAD
jgi:histidine kinase